MNEDGPVGEFLEGCGIGLGLVLLGVIALACCIFGLIGVPGLQGQVSADGILSGLFALVCGGFVFWLVILLVRKTVRAFSEGRFYRGMGLLSFILIPLLFFGVCTALIPPIHTSPNRPHQNPPVIGGDMRQDQK